MARTYWLDLFSITTWREFREHGGNVSGFTERRLPAVRRMRPGDYLLCYLTRASRWVGILEVTGSAYSDLSPIWSGASFPSRIAVQTIIALDPEYGVPVLDMRDELSVFQGLSNPNRWSGPFRGSPAKWKPSDGEAVMRALETAQSNPEMRPIPKQFGKQSKVPSIASLTDDLAVIPEADDDNETGAAPNERDGTKHTEIQYLLMKLGADIGFDVHVANNDASRQMAQPLAGRRASAPRATTAAV